MALVPSIQRSYSRSHSLHVSSNVNEIDYFRYSTLDSCLLEATNQINLCLHESSSFSYLSTQKLHISSRLFYSWKIFGKSPSALVAFWLWGLC
uniref:Uncharacterized protein n=1 Tax=Arundo donax TaxID=35708 RepID=A0A0A9CGB3_ARUDO